MGVLSSLQDPTTRHKSSTELETKAANARHKTFGCTFCRTNFPAVRDHEEKHGLGKGTCSRKARCAGWRASLWVHLNDPVAV